MKAKDVKALAEQRRKDRLPPHLAKYVDDNGDFTPEVKKRLGKSGMRKLLTRPAGSITAKDVTPAGYGPTNEDADAAARKEAAMQLALRRIEAMFGDPKRTALNDKITDMARTIQMLGSDQQRWRDRAWSNVEKHGISDTAALKAEMEDAYAHEQELANDELVGISASQNVTRLKRMFDKLEALQTNEARDPHGVIRKYFDQKAARERRASELVKDPSKVTKVKKIKKETQLDEYKPGVTVLTREISFNDYEEHSGEEDYQTVKQIRWPYGVDVKFDDANRTVRFKTAKMKTVAKLLNKHIDFGAVSAGEVLDLPVELMMGEDAPQKLNKHKNTVGNARLRYDSGEHRIYSQYNGGKRYTHYVTDRNDMILSRALALKSAMAKAKLPAAARRALYSEESQIVGIVQTDNVGTQVVTSYPEPRGRWFDDHEEAMKYAHSKTGKLMRLDTNYNVLGPLEEAEVGDRVKYRNIKTKRNKSGTVAKVGNKNGQKYYELSGSGKIVYDGDLEEGGYENFAPQSLKAKKNGKSIPFGGGYWPEKPTIKQLRISMEMYKRYWPDIPSEDWDEIATKLHKDDKAEYGPYQFSIFMNPVGESLEEAMPNSPKTIQVSKRGELLPYKFPTLPAGAKVHHFDQALRDISRELQIPDFQRTQIARELARGKVAAFGEYRFGTADNRPREMESVQEDSHQFSKGDIVIALAGPHKGDKHEVIHVFDDGSFNIRPLTHRVKYRMGAAKATADQVKPA